MIGKTQPRNARRDALDSDDEHLADFKRSEPVAHQLSGERVLNLARNIPHLGRRSLAHLRLSLQNAVRRRARKPKA